MTASGKGRILKLAGQRHEHWGHGNTAEAAAITRELDRLWQEWRAARATQISSDQVDQSAGHAADPDTTLDQFVATCCRLDADATTTVADITHAYAAWATANQQPEISVKRITRALNARGVTSERNYAGRYYRGVAMTHPTLDS